MERSGRKSPTPPLTTPPLQKENGASGGRTAKSSKKKAKKYSPADIQPVPDTAPQLPHVERLLQEKKALEQRAHTIQPQETKLAEKEADNAAAQQAYQIQCLKEVTKINFALLAQDDHHFKCSFQDACKLLEAALRLLKTSFAIHHKAKLFGHLAGFMRIRMSIRGAITDRQAALAAPLIDELKRELCKLGHELIKRLQVEAPRERKEAIRLVSQTLESEWLALPRLFVTLPDKTLPIAQQLQLALEVNSILEQLQHFQSEQSVNLKLTAGAMHIFRLYMLTHVQRLQPKNEVSEEVQTVLEKKEQWLQEYFNYKSLWNRHLMMDALPFFLSQSEDPNTRVQLTPHERAQLCFSTALSLLKTTGTEVIERPDELLQRAPTELNSEEREFLAYYKRRQASQKTEMAKAQDFAKQAAEAGISSDQQAELRIQFAATSEMIGDIKTAQMHLLAGARQAKASLHHLYLANSLWIDKTVYPLMPCKALRVWKTALNNKDGDNKPLSKRCVGYYGRNDVTRSFVEAIKSGQVASTVLSTNQQNLALSLNNIRKDNYEKALLDLQNCTVDCTVDRTIIGSLAGFLAVKLIPKGLGYLQPALEHFRAAYDNSCHEAGLEFAKLAVEYDLHTEEAIEMLKGALTFFKDNELYEEVETCDLLLDKLYKQLPKPVKAKKVKKTSAKSPSLSQKKKVVTEKLPALLEEPVPEQESSASESDSSYDSSTDDDNTVFAAEEKTERAAAGITKEPLTIQRLNTINSLILTCDFDKAEEMLNKTAPSRDRVLNGQFWQMKSWYLRQRFLCSEPGPYKVDHPAPNVSHYKSLLNLLEQAREAAEAGIRAMGVYGPVANGPEESLLQLMRAREKRTLASLYAELGHQYRERGLSTFDTRHLHTGRAMSDLADSLNPARRNRHHGATQAFEPKVQVVSQEAFASQRESED